ncbi:MAG: adenylate/guanylate cyclase domain-containing protein [Chloroflexi bacterium]|nr:adenylate/guanylate cyclase domain-containing protein [Chloroflexota bacterium]
MRATTTGLLTMSWDVLCPNCQVGKAEYFELKDLETQAHCDVCNIVFDASFDRLVEVRFGVAPAIRKVAHREYCIGGPMNTPHIVAQVPLAAGARQELGCLLGPGPYRVRSPQAAAGATFEAVADASEARLRFVITTDGIEPRRTVVAPGEVALTVENATSVEAVLTIEGSRWPDTIATAAAVGTIQEFRDLFSSEVLAPGLQLGIERLAFLFTDVIGSTALYQRVGQARAFRMVQDHFRILGDAITSHRGALVKTIGDAVMATFETGADALAAAVAMQRAVRVLDLDGAADPRRFIKVGVHQGPCVAVTLNDRLDYFGTTVNVAARVEHEAQGGEIVATADVCDLKEARAVLVQSRARLQPDVVRLRGIEEPVRVYRFEVP